jgi:hypothetical protein
MIPSGFPEDTTHTQVTDLFFTGLTATFFKEFVFALWVTFPSLLSLAFGVTVLGQNRRKERRVVTIRQLLLVVYYGDDGGLRRFPAHKKIIKDHRCRDRAGGIHTYGNSSRGSGALCHFSSDRAQRGNHAQLGACYEPHQVLMQKPFRLGTYSESDIR